MNVQVGDKAALIGRVVAVIAHEHLPSSHRIAVLMTQDGQRIESNLANFENRAEDAPAEPAVEVLDLASFKAARVANRDDQAKDAREQEPRSKRTAAPESERL